ncbi:molybdopterin converting factor subunit 1 [Thiomicrospira microaerophila]|jgi:molybdopterin synthase sulfur carrier subunit|uniref:molybdopterin converting factor subunit 1 n=1 Tax=Thiomicrospira microaerophila TaxID=406020 RepID=UPI0005C94257|nr:molybdopterin converting factor subunit 1 [Thiomicrospira microaerophila]
MVNILYFASLRETFGQAQEQVPAQFRTVGELVQSLAERGEQWRTHLLESNAIQVAVNHDIAHRETPIKAGDEVAFFPPVTGG